jgi:hypothetical protein
MCNFEGMKVIANRDLRAGENNDGDLLFKKNKKYEVLAFLPDKVCFVLINEKKLFDVVHVTNFKADE